MGKKIYVGNLPFSTTSELLGQIFSSFGQVDSSKVVVDRETGRSKGFGFVEMASAEQAEIAIKRLHGSEYGGRSLTVNEARQAEKTNNYSQMTTRSREKNDRSWQQRPRQIS